MEKFSSEEIESQYNLIKMLLAEPEKYRDAINAIKKDIAYMPCLLYTSPSPRDVEESRMPSSA